MLANMKADNISIVGWNEEESFDPGLVDDWCPTTNQFASKG